MQSKLKLINSNQIWNAKRRYKINEVVTVDGIAYQNTTGANTNPTELTDWVVTNPSSSIPMLSQVVNAGSFTNDVIDANGGVNMESTFMESKLGTLLYGAMKQFRMWVSGDDGDYPTTTAYTFNMNPEEGIQTKGENSDYFSFIQVSPSQISIASRDVLEDNSTYLDVTPTEVSINRKFKFYDIPSGINTFLQPNEDALAEVNVTMPKESGTLVIEKSKIYKALISQTGTSAPTVIIIENTIGNIVWTRSLTGKYVGTLAGAFVADKTFVMMNPFDSNSDHVFSGMENDLNTVHVNSLNAGSTTDGILYRQPILIEVYN